MRREREARGQLSLLSLLSPLTDRTAERNEAQMTEIERAQERFESAVAKHAKARTERTRLRAEMAERRLYGLQQRHCAKLARNRAQGPANKG